MKQVFWGNTDLESRIIAHLLEDEGIKTNLSGQYLSGASGELPAYNMTRVMILDDEDYDRARSLIEKWQKDGLKSDIS